MLLFRWIHLHASSLQDYFNLGNDRAYASGKPAFAGYIASTHHLKAVSVCFKQRLLSAVPGAGAGAPAISGPARLYTAAIVVLSTKLAAILNVLSTIIA
jgi:hypothetical protein